MKYWLVVEPYPSEKHELVTWGYYSQYPNIWKVMKVPWFQSTNQKKTTHDLLKRPWLSGWGSPMTQETSIPIGSMYAIYMVTWIPSIYPLYVSIYNAYIPYIWILWDIV